MSRNRPDRETPIFTDQQYEVMGEIARTKMTPELVEKAANVGILLKSQLKDGFIYFGHCRNASVATWHSDKNCFTHLRHKFGDEFLEDINHFEDDDGFDVFIPVKEVKKEKV